MIVAAYGSLKAPIALVWDNLSTHRTKDMRDFIAATEWLTVYHLAAYSVGLNPVEGVWSALRRTHHANHVFTTPEDLVPALRTGLGHLQHHNKIAGSRSRSLTCPLWRAGGGQAGPLLVLRAVCRLVAAPVPRP
ncbi:MULTISPECIES: transposase [unclassified Streptomyces]|uniref:transposase n=1 Tax=unclassified Streptomyces TaxID=2593676 RepID=UPI0009A55135|nr:transposase [Streptomyces sp. 3211]